MRGCGVGTMDCGERMKGCDGVMLDYGGRMKGYDLKLMDCVWELRDSQNEARAQEGPPGQLDHHPGNPTTPHLSHCSHYFQPFYGVRAFPGCCYYCATSPVNEQKPRQSPQKPQTPGCSGR